MEAVAVQVYEEPIGDMFLRISYSDNPHGNVARDTFLLQQSISMSMRQHTYTLVRWLERHFQEEEQLLITRITPVTLSQMEM